MQEDTKKGAGHFSNFPVRREGRGKVASAFVETSTQILFAERFTGEPRLPMLFFVLVSLVHLLSGSFKTWICSVFSFVTRNRDGTSLMTATQPDPNCFPRLSFSLFRLARVSSNIVSSYYLVGLPASVSNERSDRAANFVNFGISVAWKKKVSGVCTYSQYVCMYVHITKIFIGILLKMCKLLCIFLFTRINYIHLRLQKFQDILNF